MTKTTNNTTGNSTIADNKSNKSAYSLTSESCAAITGDHCSYGWICPKCGKVNAPWVSSCDCHLSNPGLNPGTNPGLWSPWWVGWDPWKGGWGWDPWWGGPTCGDSYRVVSQNENTGNCPNPEFTTSFSYDNGTWKETSCGRNGDGQSVANKHFVNPQDLKI